ncbi:MAG: hypothetical protein AAGK02_03830, partial [Pseudomonadota bacterium]
RKKPSGLIRIIALPSHPTQINSQEIAAKFDACSHGKPPQFSMMIIPTPPWESSSMSLIQCAAVTPVEYERTNPEGLQTVSP